MIHIHTIYVHTHLHIFEISNCLLKQYNIKQGSMEGDNNGPISLAGAVLHDARKSLHKHRLVQAFASNR